jgi:hypothetical protein
MFPEIKILFLCYYIELVDLEYFFKIIRYIVYQTNKQTNKQTENKLYLFSNLFLI